MPSTLVHLALSGLIAGTLLGDAFDRKSLLVVFAVTAFPDLDAFVAMFSTVGHRAALHNVFVPLAAGLVLYYDLSHREESFVRTRWGERGIRVAGVCLLVYVASAISLDLVSGVANPLWPVVDQFYHLGGKIEVTTRNGIVQTFVDLSGGRTGDVVQSAGTTQDVNMSTAVVPNPDSQPEGPPNRVFPVVRSGWELVLLVVGTVVTAARFRVEQRLRD